MQQEKIIAIKKVDGKRPIEWSNQIKPFNGIGFYVTAQNSDAEKLKLNYKRQTIYIIPTEITGHRETERKRQADRERADRNQKKRD